MDLNKMRNIGIRAHIDSFGQIGAQQNLYLPSPGRWMFTGEKDGFNPLKIDVAKCNIVSADRRSLQISPTDHFFDSNQFKYLCSLAWKKK